MKNDTSIRTTAAIMKNAFPDKQERALFPLIFLLDHYPLAYRGLQREVMRLYEIENKRLIEVEGHLF